MSQDIWEKLPRIDIKNPSSIKGKQLFSFFEKGQEVCVRHSNGYKKPTVRKIKITRFFTVEHPKYRADYLEVFCYLRNEGRVFKATDLTILADSECITALQEVSSQTQAANPQSSKAPLTSSPQGSRSSLTSNREIACKIIYTDLVNDDGKQIPSVQAECSRCGHLTEAYGDEIASIKRCLAQMHEDCPKGQNNFYVQE